MSVYRQLVQAGERRRHERGLSPRALSSLTWTADDRRAWNEAYRAALVIDAARSMLAGWTPSGWTADVPSERFSVHVDILAGREG